jgi:hypothetical protein
MQRIRKQPKGLEIGLVIAIVHIRKDLTCRDLCMDRVFRAIRAMLFEQIALRVRCPLGNVID